MSTDKEKLNPFFQQTKGISARRAAFYVGWPNRFLEFYRGSLDEVSVGDLKAFGN